MHHTLRLLPVQTLLLVAGCADLDEPQHKKKPTSSSASTDAQFTGETNAIPPSDLAASDTNALTTNAVANPANPFATPTPVPVAAPRDLPYGTPVPGKPGYVTSPHSPTAGYVDVKGFPPGSEVKDPYSGKIFLVP